MLRRLGLAAGVRLGPRVPAAAPSSTPTWPRPSTVDGEHTRAHRVPSWRDWVVERLRVGAHEEIEAGKRHALIGMVKAHAASVKAVLLLFSDRENLLLYLDAGRAQAAALHGMKSAQPL